MTDYELHALKLPNLTGTALSLFAAALNNSLTRSLLSGSLLENGGIPKLRTRRFTEPPTMMPLYISLERASGPYDRAAMNEMRGPQPDHFPYKTILDYAEAYRSGKTTPLEIAEKALAAIAATDRDTPALRGMMASDRNDVLAQAKASTERFLAGKPLSVFDGVPIAVKDELDQTPYPSKVGTTFFGKEPAKEDATVVARLRDAGALLIGKACMHEIGINPNGSNAHYGHARNPFDPSRDTGGSSSGPAVTAAAGLCPVAIGADGGGSIRIPSALCGLVGLKSTFGRVSEFGAAPLCWSVGHNGPLAVSVEDAALTYAAIAGPDPCDPSTQYQPPITLQDWNKPDLDGISLGVYWKWFENASEDVVKTNKMMLDNLVKAGAKIKEIEIAELDEMRIAHAITILAEMYTSMQNYKEYLHEFAPSTTISLVLGAIFTSRDYIQAQRMRTRGINIFREALSQVDAIITPATGLPAQKIPESGLKSGWSDLSTDTEMMRFIFPGNLTGLPAISFPAGYDPAGMPIGMHAMGHPWQENVLLRIAYNAERCMERRLPQRYYPVLG